MTYEPRFVFPEVLLLLAVVLPLTIYLGIRIRSLAGMRKWTAVTLRCLILIALVAALAGAEIVRIEDKLAVFFLVDASDSIPESSRRDAMQATQEVADLYMTDKDQAGVIVFGEEASIEFNVDKTLKFTQIRSFVGGEQTDLAAALRLATAAFPQGHMKRIVVYTDGNETRGSALEEAKIAQAAGIAIDIVPIRAPETPEVRLTQVDAPAQVNADEPFQIRVVANADRDTTATLRIFERAGDRRRMLPAQEVTLQEGDNTFVLPREIPSSGFYEYEVVLESPDDTIIANNQGRAFSVVQGEPTVLYVSGNPEHSAYLEPALRAEGIGVLGVLPGEMPSSLPQLQNYDAVILDDVSSTDLSTDQMRAAQAMVRDLGIGLVMIGGPNSFGAGGYLDSPVEEALPVDMDIKQRKVLPKGALALIMHTMEFPDGNAWAAEIGVAALNVLSDYDLMGMLGYMHMGGDSWIFPLQQVGNKSRLRTLIRSGTSSIGDMPNSDPTMRLAYESLSTADAAVKRILMISDGDPGAPTPGLLQRLAAEGIAVSTICINPHSQNDQTMLRDVADATGGNFYFVTNPNNLPQIFTKEAAIVKRGLLIENPFLPKVNHDSELLYGILERGLPELLGFVVTTPKDTATVPLVSDEGDPILAHWRYGLGKSVAFTSDVTNRWAANWLSWDGFNPFWSQAIRWATRELSPTNFDVESYVRDGRGHIRIDAIDDEGKFINFLRPRGVVTGPGPDYARREIELPQTGPGVYETSFPVDSSGVYMINLLYNNADGTTGTIPTGVALGYSPEYEYTDTNLPLLEQVASIGGGAVVEPRTNPFVHDLVAPPSVTPIWTWLIVFAACAFPLEIFVRRVVIPFSVIRIGVQGALRRVPGLKAIIPEPPRREAPTTGVYRAAVDRSAEFDQAAPASVAPSFGVAPAKPVAAPGAPDAGAQPAEAPKKPAASAPSGYTQQLLDAKRRAIEQKSKRVSKDD